MTPNRPPSLWTDRRGGREHDWLGADHQDVVTEPRPTPPSAPSGPRREGPPAPPRRGGGGRRAAAATAAAVLLGAGVFAGTQLDGDGSPATTTVTQGGGATVLPAVNGGAGTTRITEIYAAASPGVVSIKVAGGSGVASGTGFVIDRDGTIVTNAHVVAGSDRAQVQFEESERTVAAEVVGRDTSSDLAVLRVDPSDVGGGLQPLAFADSDDVRVGDTAIAIGFPLGLDETATAGIISGVGRSIEAPNGFSIDEVLQTDAPINPGNSGGPLLDARGRVIGVNSQIATAGAGGGNVGIGFAVPSNTVREIVPKLQSGQTIARPYLGVSTTVAPDGRGAIVGGVTAGGPAQRAGLRAGDVLLEVDGEAISAPDDVAAAIADNSPGDSVRVTLRRGGAEQTLDIDLGRRPESAP